MEIFCNCKIKINIFSIIILEIDNPLFMINQWFLGWGFPWVWEVAMSVRISAVPAWRGFVTTLNSAKVVNLLFPVRRRLSDACSFGAEVLRDCSGMFSVSGFSSAVKPGVPERGCSVTVLSKEWRHGQPTLNT